MFKRKDDGLALSALAEKTLVAIASGGGFEVGDQMSLYHIENLIWEQKMDAPDTSMHSDIFLNYILCSHHIFLT